jgi:hypothetical protein
MPNEKIQNQIKNINKKNFLNPIVLSLITAATTALPAAMSALKQSNNIVKQIQEKGISQIMKEYQVMGVKFPTVQDIVTNPVQSAVSSATVQVKHENTDSLKRDKITIKQSYNSADINDPEIKNLSVRINKASRVPVTLHPNPFQTSENLQATENELRDKNPDLLNQTNSIGSIAIRATSSSEYNDILNNINDNLPLSKRRGEEVKNQLAQILKDPNKSRNIEIFPSVKPFTESEYNEMLSLTGSKEKYNGSKKQQSQILQLLSQYNSNKITDIAIKAVLDRIVGEKRTVEIHIVSSDKSVEIFLLPISALPLFFLAGFLFGPSAAKSIKNFIEEIEKNNESLNSSKEKLVNLAQRTKAINDAIEDDAIKNINNDNQWHEELFNSMGIEGELVNNSQHLNLFYKKNADSFNLVIDSIGKKMLSDKILNGKELDLNSIREIFTTEINLVKEILQNKDNQALFGERIVKSKFAQPGSLEAIRSIENYSFGLILELVNLADQYVEDNELKSEKDLTRYLKEKLGLQDQEKY